MLKMVAALLTAASLSAAGIAADSNTTTLEDYIPSEPMIIQEQIIIEIPIELENNLLNYVETDSIDELQELIQECKERMENAENMADAARACGYDENHPIIELAIMEYEQAESCLNRYEEKYIEENAVIAEIWSYLKEAGYNDYVCAGILGNIMTEVGGHTFDIQYWLRNNSYAGMCQWSLKYFPEVPYDIKGQCDLLLDTIEENLNIFGSNYKTGFNYEEFLKLKDEREVALAFAKCYERCHPDYYDIRLDDATMAYDFFVN